MPVHSSITSIAIIDDDFAEITVDVVPDLEGKGLTKLLSNLDQDAQADLTDRGLEKEQFCSSPNDVFEAVADPTRPLGAAFAHFSEESDHLGRMIEARRNVRLLSRDLRAVSNVNVVEFAPNEVPDDLSQYQLIFLDCFLVRNSEDTEHAERIAQRIAESPGFADNQQLILMSSSERARAVRRQFRSNASVDGTSFLFVAKSELDRPWKIRANLNMLDQARPYSHLVARYVRAIKDSMQEASNELGRLLDDLDLSDFAHLQSLALQEDGHPLGEYLSWLFSSHLLALAFEGNVRSQQDLVDSVEFDHALVSPNQLSGLITKFYHSAIFARNLGPLRAHPRASSTSGSEPPLARLGDIFFNEGPTKAIVVLSADCDLSFSPGADRSLPLSASVLLVPGRPQSMNRSTARQDTDSTHGFEHESEIFRIDWSFKDYATVPIGSLIEYLRDQGFDTCSHSRLRTHYALQLQQRFANRLFRVGAPVTPPINVMLTGSVVQVRPDGTGDASFTPISCYTFDDHEISASYFDRKLHVRITLAMAGQLYSALESLHADLSEHLESLDGQERVNFQRKLEAMDALLKNDEKWLKVLGDRHLIDDGTMEPLLGSVSMAVGNYDPPNWPAVVLHLQHRNSEA